MKMYLQALQMGDFSDDELATCAALLTAIDLEKMLHNFGFEQERTTGQGFENLVGLLKA